MEVARLLFERDAGVDGHGRGESGDLVRYLYLCSAERVHAYVIIYVRGVVTVMNEGIGT